MPQLQGQHHPVYSLTDNRLLAHLLRDGGLLVPLGYPGFAKYATFRRPWKPWRLNKRLDGRRVAVASRTVSWLEAPLTKEQAQHAEWIRLRLYSPKPQGLRLEVNKRRLEPIRVPEGWHTAKLAIPRGALAPGENRVEIAWGITGQIQGHKAHAAVEWVQIGAGAPGAVELVEPARAGKLVLPRGGGLAYYVYPYEGTKLQLRFAAQAPAQRCALQVKLLSQGQPATTVTRSESALPPGDLAETMVDLTPHSGQVARLELTASGEGCKELVLEEASLVRPGPAPVVKRGPPPKNVLFWMMDNARADRYSFYNPKTRVKTPVIDGLGKNGAVFLNAYIQGTESRVSHACIWTSLYPKQHRFIAPKARLSLDWVTLPEAVKRSGRTTAAWIANGFVSQFWGFAQGFDLFRNTLHKGGGLTAERLAEHAIGFIKESGSKPFYLYIGTIDSHVSWRGRQPWLDQYYPKPYQGRFRKNVMGPTWDRIAGNPGSVSAVDRERIQAIYDSTISDNDHHLGQVVKALEEAGLLDETMIVITADHGEELWEHGRIGHGASLRDTVVKVPLLVSYPPLFGRGVKVAQGVDVLSVMPTILDALGAEAPETVQGESLLPLAHGVGTGYPRPAFASQYELAHAMRLEQFKLRVGGAGEPRLYDMSSPAQEHRDLSGERPLETRWLTDALSTFLIYQHAWRSLTWGVASNHKPALPRQLESASELRRISPR